MSTNRSFRLRFGTARLPAAAALAVSLVPMAWASIEPVKPATLPVLAQHRIKPEPFIIMQKHPAIGGVIALLGFLLVIAPSSGGGGAGSFSSSFSSSLDQGRMMVGLGIMVLGYEPANPASSWIPEPVLLHGKPGLFWNVGRW